MGQLKSLYSFGIILVALSTSSAANAANKTGITDLLYQDEIRIDLSYSLGNETPSGTYSVGSTSSSLSGQITQNSLAASYRYGITDKINIKIGYNFFQNINQELDYSIAPNSYANITKWGGVTAPDIGVQYELADKKQSGIGAIIYGSLSPAYPSSIPNAEIKTNGIVTTKGAAGTPGNDYTTASIGSTVSFPVFVGNAFATFEYIYGGNSVNSVAVPKGTIFSFTFGYEDQLNDSAKLRPYARASSMGSSNNGNVQTLNYSSYDVGIIFIEDISKKISLQLMGQLSTLNNAVTYYANGNSVNLSLSGYTIGLLGMYFY